MNKRGGPATGEVRLSDISQLFDTLVHFPFPERDLDKDAKQFIVGFARLPRDHPLDIVLYVPGPRWKNGSKDIASAASRYFDYRAGFIGRDLGPVPGRTVVLLIDVAVLPGTLLAMQAISRPFEPSPVIRILEENLIIIGWVANWRSNRDFPLRFLPSVRRRNSTGVWPR